MKASAKRPATARSGRTFSGLVYFEDRGTVYDAPLDVLWDFMEKDEKFHPKAHSGAVRNFVEKSLSEVTVLLSYERRRRGRWEKLVCRMTTIRPAARVQEDLDGPYAGTKTVYLYTPQGKRTAVDIFGYAQSSELTPDEIKRDKKETFSRAFSEDVPYLRRFAEQHPSLQTKRK